MLNYGNTMNFLVEVNSICKAANRPLAIQMTTNGYNLSIEKFEKLFSLKVFSYVITLDGVEEDHNSTRMLMNDGETFETIINNLISISKLKYMQYEIVLRTNFTGKSFKRIKDFRNLLKKFSRMINDLHLTGFMRLILARILIALIILIC